MDVKQRCGSDDVLWFCVFALPQQIRSNTECDHQQMSFVPTLVSLGFATEHK